MNRGLLFLLLSVSLASTFAQEIMPAMKPPCNMSEMQLLATGNFMFPNGGDIGHPSACFPLPESRWCSAFMQLMCIPKDKSKPNYTMPFPTWCGQPLEPSVAFSQPTVGICLSESCPTDAANAQLQELFQTDVNMTLMWGGRNGVCALPGKYFPEDCSDDSYGFPVIVCDDDWPKWYNSNGAIIMFAICMAIAGLFVVGTCVARVNDIQQLVVEYHKQRRTESESSVKDERAALLNKSDDSNAEEEKQRFWISPNTMKWVNIFDLLYQLRQFFSVTNRSSGDCDTRFFEGMRTIAMALVVYGHSLYFPESWAIYGNEVAFEEFFKEYASIAMIPALLAVDTFFYLSGFLFMHLYLKQIYKMHDKKQQKLLSEGMEDIGKPMPLSVLMTLKMYLRRWFRMTPVVMFTVFGGSYLLPFLATGPFAKVSRNNELFTMCHEKWWVQLFYINNLGFSHNWGTCMGWFWYLSCDFQLFIVAPIIAAMYLFYPPLFYFVVMGGIFTVSGLQCHYLGFVDFSSLAYYKTWFRFSPYFWGLLTAVMVRHNWVKKLGTGVISRHFLYAASLCLVVLCINLMWKMGALIGHIGIPPTHHIAFYRFAHFTVILCWGLGLGLATVVWTTKAGGFVKSLLGSAPFIILSKLTFCCYMIHPFVIATNLGNDFHRPYFNPMSMLTTFAGNLVWSFVGALALHIGVEMPMAELNNILTK